VVWRVRWTTPGWTDVEEIARYIGRDSPRYALILQREAQAAASSLRRFARRGRVVPERDDANLRELIIGNSFRLIYKIVAHDEVHVIAFVNAARDLDAFLKIENRE
jgi:toxin ParE1/3/4